jgi:hypothetical protein
MGIIGGATAPTDPAQRAATCSRAPRNGRIARESWLARKDSNLQSPDPESGALPLGHSPATGPPSACSRAAISTAVRRSVPSESGGPVDPRQRQARRRNRRCVERHRRAGRIVPQPPPVAPRVRSLNVPPAGPAGPARRPGRTPPARLTPRGLAMMIDRPQDLVGPPAPITTDEVSRPRSPPRRSPSRSSNRSSSCRRLTPLLVESALQVLGLSDIIPNVIHLCGLRARRALSRRPGVALHTTTRPLDGSPKRLRGCLRGGVRGQGAAAGARREQALSL